MQLRQVHTTTAQSLKSMKKNELLQILEEFVPNGYAGEAILTAKTVFTINTMGVFLFHGPKERQFLLREEQKGTSLSSLIWM